LIWCPFLFLFLCQPAPPSGRPPPPCLKSPLDPGLLHLVQLA
jgi:hypothetical protein